MSAKKAYSEASWMSGNGPLSDIVISTRVRLARNIKNMPFPMKAEAADREKVSEMVKDAVKATKAIGAMDIVNLVDLSETYRQVLVEEHLASPQLVRTVDGSLLITNRDKSVSIMVNEEDHLRVQAITSGLSLFDALKLAQDADDALEEKLEYAFDEKLGYLTSCPTNVGTGLRASVMLHLPALAMLNMTSQVLGAVTKMGLTIRGMFGEGTETIGNIVQLSNAVTLGKSEEEIIKHLEAVTKQIVERESDARKALKKDANIQLADRLRRAYGVASQALVMSTDEAFRVLSDVKLGCDLEVISEIDKEFFASALANIMPAHIEKKVQKTLNIRERDIERASFIRLIMKPLKEEV